MSLLGTTRSRTLPDYTQLGGRLFVVDGVNANRVFDGWHTEPRPMGTLPQYDDINAALASGTALEPQANYTYGVRRVVRVGSLEIPSAVTTSLVQTERYGLQCGSAGTTTLSDWTSITDGSFVYTNSQDAYNIVGLDFSGAGSMREVAGIIQKTLQDIIGIEIEVYYDDDNTRFEFYSPEYEIEPLATHPDGTGTDISGSGYLNGQSSAATKINNLQATLDVLDYPSDLKPPTGAYWSVYYQVLRSKANATQSLYLVKELTQAERDALSSNQYTDTITDDNLDTSVVARMDEIRNYYIPPVRYICNWQGSLFCGGSIVYKQGTVSGTSGSAALTVNSPGQVNAADIRALVWIDGEQQTFRIIDVDTANNQYTLDEALGADRTEVAWARWHDRSTIFVSEPIPDNIEGYTVGRQLYSNTGGNDPLAGLAVGGSYAYALRRHSVELITGDPTGRGYGLEPHPMAPPGCASHATIADQHNTGVIYYAGNSGVWQLAGTEAKKISAGVDPIIRNEVDHSVDDFTHAVYVPDMRTYFLWLFPRYWLRKTGNRIPSLLLMYDEENQQWYRGQMEANASALWRDNGRLTPVIAIGDTVATLNSGDSDGPFLKGTATGGDTDHLYDTTRDFTAEEIVPGQPITVFKSYDNRKERRLIAEISQHAIAVHGSWQTLTPEDGDTYYVGAIPWSVTSQEMTLGQLRHRMKVESVDVVHTRDDVSAQTSIAGPRGHGVINDTDNWAGDDVHTLKAHKAGLRTRTLQVRVKGETAPAGILGLEVAMTPVHRE